jgi:acetyl esterase/lipase
MSVSMKSLPGTIPRAFLAEAREAKERKVAIGYRYTATNAREAMEVMTRRCVTRVPAIPLVRDELIPGPAYAVPVRLYHPAPSEALPVALFAHGGGHVAGSVSLYDPIARKLAVASRRLVVAVDYRLAPECPYPSALQDFVACVKGLFGHAEDRRKVSPLFMSLTWHYPPTLVVTAEYCPLRDAGGAYVQRLRESDLVCAHLAYAGLVHGFLNLEDLVPDACGDLYRRIGAFLEGVSGATVGDDRWTGSDGEPTAADAPVAPA